MRLGARAVVVIGVIIAAGCARQAPVVEDVGGGRDVSRLKLERMRGTRDGDRLAVRAEIGDYAGKIRMNLQFEVGVPTRLVSGTWSGWGGEGSVRERSVTFLGGQSGPPSLGGRFDLLSAKGSVLYRVTIPVQELRERL